MTVSNLEMRRNILYFVLDSLFNNRCMYDIIIISMCLGFKILLVSVLPNDTQITVLFST